MSWPQLQIGLSEFSKPCFNLCSWRCLRPRLNLVSYLTPLGLWHLKKLFPEGRTNSKSFFLKIFKFSGLRIFWSSLFHSITIEGKNEFWKKFSLDIPLTALVIANAELYWTDSIFWWNDAVYAWSYIISP